MTLKYVLFLRHHLLLRVANTRGWSCGIIAPPQANMQTQVF